MECLELFNECSELILLNVIFFRELRVLIKLLFVYCE